MPARLKRRGAPLGNQNARKHGFYSSVLSPAQLRFLPRAKAIRGLNDETGIARVRLASVVATAPDNVRVLSAAINSLIRLERAKHAIRPSSHRRRPRRQAPQDAKRQDHLSGHDITASLPTLALFKWNTPYEPDESVPQGPHVEDLACRRSRTSRERSQSGSKIPMKELNREAEKIGGKG